MYSDTVISLIDPKQAALYFRYVIPCNMAIDIIKDERAGRTLSIGAIRSIIPEHLRDNPHFIDRLIEINEVSRQLCAKVFIESGRCQGPICGVSPDEYSYIEQRFNDALNSFNNDFGLSDNSIDFPFEPTGVSASGDIVVSLIQIPLIDTRSASWAQIEQIRIDQEAMRRLRRLRLFMSDNYSGKSKAYIEDDLGQRLDQYLQVARKAGLETVLGAFGTLLDSQLLAGGLIGSFISVLAGEPIFAALSAGSTALIEIGKASLQIRKNNAERKVQLEQNPVSYLSYADAILKKMPDKSGGKQ